MKFDRFLISRFCGFETFGEQKKKRENGQKSQKLQNLTPAKFNTFKVYRNIGKTKGFVRFIESFKNAIK